MTPAQKKMVSAMFVSLNQQIAGLKVATPVNREYSLAITKLEEASFWLGRAFEVMAEEDGPIQKER